MVSLPLMIALHGSVSYSIFGIRDRINAPMPMRRSDVWCPAGGFQIVLDQFWVHKRRRRKSEPKKFKKKIAKEKNENWIRQPKKTRRHGRTVNIDGGFMTRKDHLDWFRVYTDTDVYER